MTLAIIQARLGSSRLPGKMLRRLAGRPALEHTLERARAARGIDRLVVATTDLPLDDPLAQFAEELGVTVFRGHPEDVLDRYYQAAKAMGASPEETIVRLTGDCPMHDPAVIDRVIREYEQAHRAGAPPVEYASNISPPSFPSGLDVEAFSLSALEAAWREATRDYEREHVTLYIRDHPERFPSLNISCPEGDLSGLRWTLDVEEDAAVLNSLLSLGAAQEAAEFSYRAGLRTIEQNSSISNINSAVGRNTPVVEAVLRAVLRDSSGNTQAKSREICRKAEEVLAPPVPIAPFEQPGRVAARARGCRVWDADDNECIDFRMGDGTSPLGYGDSAAEIAGTKPAGGVLPRVMLASRLLERFPSQGRAAFFDSHREAFAVAAGGAARRTGRRRVLSLGAPLFDEELRGDESATREWSDLVSLEFVSRPLDGGTVSVGAVAEAAAVIVEPIIGSGGIAKVPGDVAEMSAAMGTLLIVNPTPLMLAGGRLDLGECPPKLNIAVVIGSGLANGLAFGALLGAAEIFESRFGGLSPLKNRANTVPIATALENLDKLENVAERSRVCSMATNLWRGIESIVTDFRLFGYCELNPHPPHLVFRFRDSDLFRGTSMQFLFEDLMISHGLIWGPILTVTPAHGDGEIAFALDAARSSARALRTFIDNRAVERVFDAETKRLGYGGLMQEPANAVWGSPKYRATVPAGIPA